MSGGDWKALFKGVQENEVELVKFYLRSGIDPNYQHPEFMALPLSESIRYNYPAIVEALLAHGADPSITEMESGKTPLQLARQKNHPQILQLLEQYKT